MLLINWKMSALGLFSYSRISSGGSGVSVGCEKPNPPIFHSPFIEYQSSSFDPTKVFTSVHPTTPNPCPVWLFLFLFDLIGRRSIPRVSGFHVGNMSNLFSGMYVVYLSLCARKNSRLVTI